MENQWVMFAMVIGVVVLIGGGFLLRYLQNNVLNPAGKGAEKITARTLTNYGRLRSFRVLRNLTLEVNGKTAYIENMLIGFFGILIVHTCGARGDFYGTVDGKDWILHQDSKRTTFPNPLLEQQKALAMLRSAFSKEKLYNLPMENLVVLTSRGSKTALYITHSGEILLPGKLRSYLDKTKFDKDLGLDVARIAEVVLANCQK